MYGMTTLHRINRERVIAARILEQHDTPAARAESEKRLQKDVAEAQARIAARK